MDVETLALAVKEIGPRFEEKHSSILRRFTYIQANSCLALIENIERSAQCLHTLYEDL